jgi:probable F420-dependent oxidoreductase
MKVGVNLINFGPGASPETLARAAALAEELGYHAVLISDHVAVTPDVAARYPAPFYDPFTALAWLAGLTRRVELGTTVVILPYRHPLLTARMAANVDRLSGGRLILGVGAGWARQEFDALGLPFHRRGAMTDDYLAAIRAAWAGEVASHAGPFARFSEVRTAPRPIREPHPPIWVCGASDAALRRAARHGDGWHPFRFRLDWLRSTGLPRLREHADAAGRPVPALCPRVRARLVDSALPDEGRIAAEGSLDQMRGDLEALEALGAEYVVLDTYADDPEATRDPSPGWRTLELLAARVLDLPRERLR